MRNKCPMCLNLQIFTSNGKRSENLLFLHILPYCYTLSMLIPEMTCWLLLIAFVGVGSQVECYYYDILSLP